MIGDEVWVWNRGESERVEEKEPKDNHDGSKNAPPKFAVHQGLYGLFSINEILHREIERVEGPDVERSQCPSEWENDE